LEFVPHSFDLADDIESPTPALGVLRKNKGFEVSVQGPLRRFGTTNKLYVRAVAEKNGVKHHFTLVFSDIESRLQFPLEFMGQTQKEQKILNLTDLRAVAFAEDIFISLTKQHDEKGIFRL